MKRNLFAMFLAVALVVALVFVVAPSAKAESYTFTETDREFSISEDSILDMAGFSGKVTLSNGAKLTVYDSGNTSKTGENVAQLTVEGDGSVEKITLQNGYRYLKVENTNGTYSFHPFNMAFTHIGLNTKTNSVCVRAAFIANNVVKAKLTDYGIYSTVHEEYASCAEKYPFNNANGVYAYYDFVNSFGEEDIDSTKSVKLYMTVDGETVETDYTASFIPRKILKKINAGLLLDEGEEGKITLTDSQKTNIKALIATNVRVANNLLSLQEAEEVTKLVELGTLSFNSTENRLSQTTSQQVWSQNGITFTNNKSSSQTNVANYSNPVRLYKNSEIIIDALGMAKVVLNCNKAEHTTNLKAALDSADVTYTVEGNTITIDCSNPFTLKLSGGAVWLNSISVYKSETELTEPSCKHGKNLSEATCKQLAVCIDCEKEHGELSTKHTGGTATCTEQAVCTICGEAYGDLVDHDYVNGTCTTCGDKEFVVPEADSLISIEDANTLGLTKEHDTYTTDKYYVEGEITEVYNTTYGNMYIKDENGNKLTIYGLYASGTRYDAMPTKPVAGDTIKVYGAIGQYNGTAQIKNAEYIHDHVNESVVTAPTCNAGGYTTHTCSICGYSTKDNETEKLEHVIVDGKCTNAGCNYTEGGTTTEPTTVTVTMSALGWTNESKHTSLAMDDNISVNLTGGTNTGKFYTSGNNWRLYQTESAKLTISAANGKTITSVKITFTVSNSGQLKQGSTVITSGSVVNVNADTIEFNVGGTASKQNGQVRITAIEVIYQ